MNNFTRDNYKTMEEKLVYWYWNWNWNWYW